MIAYPNLFYGLVQDFTNVFICDSSPEADREPESSEKTCDTLYLAIGETGTEWCLSECGIDE
jgi:hypothetical protein